MRASLCLLLLVAFAASGGCAGRFNTLASGDYTCTATLSLNTCTEVLPTMTTFTSPLRGGGTDTMTLEVPSRQSRFRGEVVTADVQFGLQEANPNSYFVTSGTACRPDEVSADWGLGGMPSLVSTEIDAQLVTVGDDALEIRLTYRYPDFSECTLSISMSEACEMVWEIDCARAP